MYFLICSYVDDDVIKLKFADLWKTQKPKYLEKETQFFPTVKKIINYTFIIAKDSFLAEVTFKKS